MAGAQAIRKTGIKNKNENFLSTGLAAEIPLFI
jgi:hypothetical protein